MTMTREEIEKLIDKKIFQHELKIAILSSIPGLLILFGIFHAFTLVR